MHTTQIFPLSGCTMLKDTFLKEIAKHFKSEAYKQVKKREGALTAEEIQEVRVRDW